MEITEEGKMEPKRLFFSAPMQSPTLQRRFILRLREGTLATAAGLTDSFLKATWKTQFPPQTAARLKKKYSLFLALFFL